MKAFIGLLLFAVAYARQAIRCPENQHFDSCGTDCPLTCDNYETPPIICNLMCVARCFCDDGYVENSLGECVRPEDCPKKKILQSDAEKKCLSRAETGVCRALFYKWFYNAETGKCAQFVYGGCGGNENKYDTEEQCLETCSGIRISAAEICELPVTNGSCLLVWDRYYFDKTSGECKSFKDGDCGGNLNNFDTIEECNEKCLPSGENN